MILIFDDEKGIRENFKKELIGQNIGLEVLECNSKADVREKLQDKEKMGKMKVLVFDLSTSREEAESGHFEILEDIKNNYSTYAIPIFIHSAFANIVEGYDNLGTLFKVDKTDNSISAITTKIKLFQDSGFLDIFCSKGSLEQEIHKEILKAFNFQFLGEEVTQIIESIQHADPTNLKNRTKAVFERIAIRALYQNLLSAKKIPEIDKFEECKVNAVENYYRRTSDFKLWTGDIFSNNETGENVIILTPRCNLSNGKFKELLLCEIKSLKGELINTFKKEANLKKGLTDDVTLIHVAERFRFLTTAPQFEGGVIDFNYCFSMQPEIFLEQYSIKISLIDDLTNDVVRKFASYILRGGVSVTELKEALFYIGQI